MSTTVTHANTGASTSARPVFWVLCCAGAECIGMTASAAAARQAAVLPGLAALAVIVLGGLIEGTALGVLQAIWLTRRFSGVSMAGWILTTIVIAGVGWALASAPGALGGTGGTEPPVVLVLLGGAALGAAMGALMGAAQALVLRRHVRHPWRWISISAAAWTPTMLIIFIGAALPDSSWTTGAVIALGTATGLIAGGVLGVVSAALMHTLQGQSVWSDLLARALLRNAFGLGRRFALLRITGVVTGRTFEFPVQYARASETVVILVGRAEHKTWWRNLAHPSALSIRLDGGWRSATGRIVHATDEPTFDELRAAYARRWSAIRVPDDAMLVRIDLVRGA